MTQELMQVNKQEAELVLNEIDTLLQQADTAAEQAGKCFVNLSLLLVKAKRGAYWTERGFKSEQEYIEKTFQQSRAQYYKLIRVGTHLGSYPKPKLLQWGSSKCEDLVRLQVHFNGEVPDEWMQSIEEDNKDVFRKRVKDFFDAKDHKETGERKEIGDEHVDNSYVTIKLFGNGIHTYKIAVDTMRKICGSDNESHCVAMIMANFLSQFADDGTGHVSGKNAFILSSVEGLVKQLDLKIPDTDSLLIGIIAKAVEHNTAT